MKNLLFLSLPGYFLLLFYNTSESYHVSVRVFNLMIIFLTFIALHKEFFIKEPDEIRSLRRLQLVITNFCINFAFFKLTIENYPTLKNEDGANLIFAILSVIIILIIISIQYNKYWCNSWMNEKLLYKSFSNILAGGWYCFMAYQFYTFWGHISLVVPVASGTIMMGTIYQHGFIPKMYERPPWGLNWLINIVILWVIGLIAYFT